jgi:hypothetical protein
VGFEVDDAVAALTQQNVVLLDLPIEVRHQPYERGLRELQVDADDLVVVFVAPPWGDALTPGGELDLRRTSPPIAEIIDRVVTRFETQKLLIAVQLYEQVEPGSLAEIVDGFDWWHRQTYAITPPGKNPGLLCGTVRWTP